MKHTPLKNSGPVSAALIPAGVLVGLFTLVRLVLLAMSRHSATFQPLMLAKIFWTGLRFDLFVAGVFVMPLATYSALAPERFLRTRIHQAFSRITYFLFLFFFFFMAGVEIAFFDEFDARFNYIAVDYLLYPTEVANNIWQSYPVAWIVLCVAIAAGLVYWLTRKAFTARLKRTAPLSRRAAGAGFLIAICAALYFTVGMNAMQVSANRVDNEIAGNSYYTLFFSFWSNELDYQQYYRTIDPKEAVRRAREIVRDSESRDANKEEPNPLERSETEHGPLHRPNFVILVEESFGANFTQTLGRNPENLTPSFDHLAKDGILFTNFYATGSRTVRGLEAILCGFPPVPGESILKRDRSENVFTLADILKSKGYATLFVYGGRGMFDNMRSFMMTNGFDRFVEQKDFVQPAFASAWGVCDEDIFHRTIEELDAMDRQGKNFFTTVLSVSNHKPYTYPEGRIDLDPKKHRRQNAVKYADWAIGDFFARAKKYPFFDKTVFVVIGDHGARVYGADFIPIASYEVPFLIYAPGRLKPRKIDTLACSMDVAPTLLGLTDFSYNSVFFGKDLFDVAPDKGFALLQHDRDIGYLRGDKLAVLGLMKTAQVFRYDRNSHAFSPIQPMGAEEENLIQDGTALYQTAYSFYKNRIYHLNQTSTAPLKDSAVQAQKPPLIH